MKHINSLLCKYTIDLCARSGMGNFKSDDGRHFFSFIPRGQITYPRPHTVYTVSFHFLFIERNERIIHVFKDFINNKTCAFMLAQKGIVVVS